jgi:hypothetical protein
MDTATATTATATITDAAADRGRARALRAGGLAGPLALLFAAAVPVADRGGFTPDSRALFAALAAIALSVALVRDERPVLGFARSPAIGCLLGLATLSVASAAWTVGDPAAALRWGMVVAAVAATALVAAQLAAGKASVAGLAAFVAGLAAVEAVLGLGFAGLRLEPFAERIGGSWRPGGSFEYPPALALLQIAALPALMRAMARSRLALALPAAAAAALAGTVVALAASRTETALALLVVATGIVAAPRALGVPRRAAAAVALVPAGAGLAAYLVAGGYAWPGETGGDAGRLVGLLLILFVATAAWALFRGPLWARLTRPLRPLPRGRLAVASTVAAVAASAAIAVASLAGGSGRRWVEPVSGFTHGRSAEWSAAARTALDHPISGAGADAYLAASADHQGDAVTLYAHDLPLESWAELGPLGLALTLGLYASVAALLWRIRRHPEAWLVAPGAAAFLLANLVDWPWHLAGAAAVWAICLGGCLALVGRVGQASG